MSEVTFLEMNGKQFVRSESKSGRVSSSSRTTPSTAAYAGAAPKSCPVVIQIPVASQTANAGIRKTSPTSGALDPGNFREKRRKPQEFNTHWVDISPEKAGRSHAAREGHSSQHEGARSSSSNVRSDREGHSSHRLAPPLWSGTSRSLPDPSQYNKIVPHVRSAREGHSSLVDLNSVRSAREGHSSLANASTLMILPSTYGPARRIDIMSTPENRTN